MPAQGTATLIHEKLVAGLAPTLVTVVDESHQHIGHAGATGGGGHYKLTIVADCFSGLPLLRRHRMIYEVLQHQLANDIHALSIQAFSPEEYSPAGDQHSS